MVLILIGKDNMLSYYYITQCHKIKLYLLPLYLNDCWFRFCFFNGLSIINVFILKLKRKLECKNMSEKL